MNTSRDEELATTWRWYWKANMEGSPMFADAEMTSVMLFYGLPSMSIDVPPVPLLTEWHAAEPDANAHQFILSWLRRPPIGG